MKTIILKTERLILRNITEDDVKEIFSLYRNENVCKYYDIKPFTEINQGYEQIKKWKNLFFDRKQIRLGIILKGKLIGTCGIYSIYWHQKRASIGFDLLPEYWGKGLMAEALAVFLNYCFRELEIHRLQALVLKENEASKKLLLELGFKYEGTLRDYEIWEGKGFVNLEIYSLLNIYAKN